MLGTCLRDSSRELPVKQCWMAIADSGFLAKQSATRFSRSISVFLILHSLSCLIPLYSSVLFISPYSLAYSSLLIPSFWLFALLKHVLNRAHCLAPPPAHSHIFALANFLIKYLCWQWAANYRSSEWSIGQIVKRVGSILSGWFFGFFLWILPLDSFRILLAILLGFSFWSFFALLDTLLGFPLLFALPLDSLYAIPTVKLIRNQKFSASCRDLLCLTFNYLPSQFGGIRRLIKFKPPIAKIRGQREGDVWSEGEKDVW